jgi:hypothetical protein
MLLVAACSSSSSGSSTSPPPPAPTTSTRPPSAETTSVAATTGETSSATSAGSANASTSTPGSIDAGASTTDAAGTADTVPGSDTPPSFGDEPLTVVEDITLGPGTFDLDSTVAGLADLPSYNATLTLSFDGTNAGQPSSWSRSYVALVTAEPAQRQLTIDVTGDEIGVAHIYRASVGEVSYEKRDQNPCSANVIEPDETNTTVTDTVATGAEISALEPAQILLSAFGADPAGSEDVNGVPTDHYTFDERALGQQGVATSTGSVWVATTGGYIVKYVLTTNAKADYFGDGIEGALTYDYELTGVGQPVIIAVPPDCPPGLLGLPTMPDATNVENDPGATSYDSASALADIAAFYQGQLPQLGWVYNDDADVDDVSMHLTFTQGAQLLSVDADVDAGIASVTLAEFSVPVPEG